MLLDHNLSEIMNEFVSSSINGVSSENIFQLQRNIGMDISKYTLFNQSICSAFGFNINVPDKTVYLIVYLQNEHILKFDSIYTAKYFAEKDAIQSKYVAALMNDINHNASFEYNEQSVTYNGNDYNIAIIRNNKDNYYLSLVDSISREVVLTVVNTADNSIKVSAKNIATKRFPNITGLNDFQVDLDSLPSIIKEQILATVVMLSLQ